MINCDALYILLLYCNYTPISGRASQVGGEPGITKAVLTKIQVSVEDIFVPLCVLICTVYNCLRYQVCERPIMYLLDTPGVLPPKIESVETGMKLALCGEWEFFFFLLYTVTQETSCANCVVLYSVELL